nr:hypothetical protein [Tanacetum cinerariifolium]
MYNVNLRNIVPYGDLTCHFAKATLDESNLWHRRLGHVNFKTINKLVKGNLVRGLPTKVFTNDNSCVACKKGKQHRASCKSKPISSVDQPLFRLHMDLFGPTFVKSLSKKSYCLVITDDYSRFSWGIKREFSVPRTPQQNGIAERKNRTLIEATRTLLVDLLLSIPFWAEAVNTACYVQNRVLVTKPHNKTPYELLHSRLPSIGFMRSFSCPVTILNFLDHFGKFQGKVDEGFLIGYSVCSSGPAWLFDIDSLTKTMNYHPIINKNKDALVDGNEHDDDIQKYVSPDIHSSKSGFMDLNVKFKECTNNIINGVNTASSSVSTTGHKFINSTNDFSAVGPSNTAASPTVANSSSQDASTSSHDSDMPNLEDLTHSDDVDDVGAEADINNLESIISEPKRVHQALKDPSWIEAMQEELLQFKMQKVWILVDLPYRKRAVVYQMDVKSVFLYGTIKEEVYVCQPLGFEDPENLNKVKKVVKALYGLHQVPRAWSSGKSASTPIDAEKPLLKDSDGKDVDVHTYRSMIGSLMYLTSSRPDIMFAVCACARFQVTLKVSHLNAVKRIFRYFKGKPYLGLWYPKDSPFDLVAYSDSDYAGASLDRKSTTGGFKRSDDVTRLQALVDRKKIVISEDVICEILQLDDAEGVVRKGFSWVETPLFEGMLAAKEIVEEGISEEQVQADDVVAAAVQETVAEDVANEDILSTPTPLILPSPPSHNIPSPSQVQSSPPQQPQSSPQAPPQAAQKLEIIKLKARVKRLENANTVKSSKLRCLKKVGTSQRIVSSDDIKDVFNQGRMIDDLDKDKGIELVVDQVKDVDTAKIEGRHAAEQAEKQAEIYHLDLDHPSKVLISAASATISAAKPSIPAAAPTIVAAYIRRRKGVIIKDLEEELSSKTPVETPKLKVKGKGILIKTLKPMKKKDQIELDAKYARKLHVEINKDHKEINKDIDWDAAIDHTESEARKNIMIYLKNTAGYKLDFFKGMSYDEIRLIFQARFDANMRFLFKSREEIEEEDQEVLKSINETPAQKAAKRRKLNEEAQEVEDLKKHLEVVNDKDDDVFTKAAPFAKKVPVVDYQIVLINNKPRFKIIKADENSSVVYQFHNTTKEF